MSPLELQVQEIERRLSDLKEMIEANTEQVSLPTIIAEKNARIQSLELQLKAQSFPKVSIPEISQPYKSGYYNPPMWP